MQDNNSRLIQKEFLSLCINFLSSYLYREGEREMCQKDVYREWLEEREKYKSSPVNLHLKLHKVQTNNNILYPHVCLLYMMNTGNCNCVTFLFFLNNLFLDAKIIDYLNETATESMLESHVLYLRCDSILVVPCKLNG